MYKIKILILIITIFAILILNSCLKTTSKDFFIAGNYFNTIDDYKSAHIGVYAMLLQDGTYGRNLWSYFDFGNDELNQNRLSVPNTMINYNYTATESNLNDTWIQLYGGIGRANTFLNNLQNLPDSLKFYAAEVRFLRGYFYFLLAQHWGNVPIKIAPADASTMYTNFQPVDSVYLFAINDMLTAYPDLQTIQQTNNSVGRVNKSICAGILARVYLYAASYCQDADKASQYKTVKGRNFEAQLKNTSAKVFLQQAKNWADTVIKNPYYGPSGITGISYDNIFINQAQDLYYPKETMWEVDFYGNRAGAYSDYFTAGRVGVFNGISGPSGAAYGYLAPYLRANYDTTNDLRYKRNFPYFAYTYVTANGGLTITGTTAITRKTTCGLGKWRRTDEKLLPLNTSYTPTNFPLLRYSDVVLMAAEASNELILLYGESIANTADISANLDAIRSRANINSFPSNWGTYSMRDSIRIERSKELAGEGLRRQDLIRWGIYLEQINTTLQLYSTLMQEAKEAPITLQNILEGGLKFTIQPIPQRELNLNKASNVAQHPLWQ